MFSIFSDCTLATISLIAKHLSRLLVSEFLATQDVIFTFVVLANNSALEAQLIETITERLSVAKSLSKSENPAQHRAKVTTTVQMEETFRAVAFKLGLMAEDGTIRIKVTDKTTKEALVRWCYQLRICHKNYSTKRQRNWTSLRECITRNQDGYDCTIALRDGEKYFVFTPKKPFTYY